MVHANLRWKIGAVSYGLEPDMLAAEVTLWLFVITLGIALGAGLYEARVVLPLWYRVRDGSESEWNGVSVRHADAGRRFWPYVTTAPLTTLTLVSLIFAWNLSAPRRALWLAAAAVILLERIATFTYFIPAMLRLQHDETLPEETARATISWLILLYWMRNLTYAVSWLAALAALAMNEPDPPP